MEEQISTAFKIALAIALAASTGIDWAWALPPVGEDEPLVQPHRCEADGEDALVIEGLTDDAMLQCVRRMAPQFMRRITITSFGGPVDVALAIAEQIAPYRPHIIVRGQCNSSCANYILPVARRITVERGSLIGLHGSLGLANIDGAPLDRKERMIEVVRQQDAFAARYAIHPGWLMKREPGDGRYRFGPYVEGDAEVVARLPKPGTARSYSGFLIAEEGFLRSCFPGIEIDRFVKTSVEYFYARKSFAKLMLAQGTYPSGPMRCRPRDKNGQAVARSD